MILRKERPHPGAQLTFTDADGHRVTALHHRHRHPGSCPVSSPAWNCATANTPGSRTGSARPRRPDCATCPVTAPQRQHRLAGNHPGRNRSGGLGTADRFRRPCRARHAARSTRSATGCCTSPPASPRAPATTGYASTRPGGGPTRYIKGGNDFGRPSPNESAPVHTDPRNPPALESPPPATPADPSYPTSTIRPSQSNQRRIHPSRQRRTKNRG